MDFVRVQHQNVVAVNTEVQRSSQCPLSMEEVLTLGYKKGFTMYLADALIRAY